VRPRSGREGALGYVRRDCVSLAQLVGQTVRYKTTHPTLFELGGGVVIVKFTSGTDHVNVLLVV